MIETLQPVWKQFTETYQDLRLALARVPDNALTWSPGGEARSVAHLVQHIASANLLYVRVMEFREPEEWAFQPAPSRAWLEERLDESEAQVREVFESMTPELLERYCAADWTPLSEENLVGGGLTALWFALQVLRHTAYHLGQLNTYLLVLAAD